MRIGTLQPTTYRPPGGSVQPFSQELTETFFRAIAAQSTSAVIGPGFLSLELRAAKAGKAQFVWHFNDDIDPETARASIQIMLDTVARPLLQGARWAPHWTPREQWTGSR
ncbi:MAG: hypothetical protein ACT4O6_04495 [Reyranella sp.]